MKNFTLSLAVLSLLAVSLPAMGDDFSPPSWRGQPLSLRAEWEFSQPPENWYNIAPEVLTWTGDGAHPLYNDFTTHAEVFDSSKWAWNPGDGDGMIISQQGDSIGFKLQNFMDDEPLKLVQIQITWTGQIAPVITGVVGEIGYLPDRQEYQGQMIQTLQIDATHILSTWQIVPNPWWDVVSIGIPPMTGLDEVVIDTVSLPEPATLSLLALGSLAWLRRKNGPAR